MATKARKPAPAKGKATQSKAGAGPAIAARSKDAKPAFGKAAPKKVVPTAAKPKKPANPSDSLSGSAMRTAKATANVAAGAVMVAARGAASLAASVMGKGGSKAKAKAK
jgi:large subunit ribosomal protein L23Ae